MKSIKKKKFTVLQNKGALTELFKQSFGSVFPITLIIILLCFSICPLPSGTFLAFILGALLLIIGMSVFTLGADTAMMPIGDYIGRQAVGKKRMWVILFVSFIVGTLITVSEPDLTVLAGQVEGVPNLVLILAVSLGVGVFLSIAMLRSFLKIPLRIILLIMYIATFTLSFFVPKEFVPVAFDSGGVTTGPMSVPFIMALGAGAASMRNDKNSESDSFGIMALCSIGPILAVMLLGLIYRPEESVYTPAVINPINDSRELIVSFVSAIPEYMAEVAKALLPIILFYFLFMLFCHKPPKSELIKILIGIGYTYFGLVLFLIGVNIGFLPAGSLLGTSIAMLKYNWIIIPIGMVVGYFVVAAEPAVHVLNKQVGEITQGAIPEKALGVSLGVGVALSIGLSMARIYFDFNLLYILIPGYSIALILMFFVPEIFTSIAFDSGGVASGAMTASFVLPLAIGYCVGIGGDVTQSAFGVVAMVAMMPIITIQLLGLLYKFKMRKIQKTNKNIEKEDIIT